MEQLNLKSIYKVVAIVINYNQSYHTIECLRALHSSNSTDLSIIVIDNSTKPSERVTLDQLRENNMNHIVRLEHSEKNLGYVGAINYALQIGETYNPEYFLIINNDTIIDPNAIHELTKTCISYNNRAIVSGKAYDYYNRNRLQYIGSHLINKSLLKYSHIGINEFDTGQYNKAIEFDLLDDIFWVFPAELYKEIGGYNKYFWFNSEQADFALRAKKEGYKLIYTPEARIWHKGSLSIGGREYNSKLVFWAIQSGLILRFLHLNRIAFSIYFLLTLKSVLTTYIRAVYNFIFSKKSLFKYAKAKLFAVTYFIIWTINKKENSGYNPF